MKKNFKKRVTAVCLSALMTVGTMPTEMLMASEVLVPESLALEANQELGEAYQPDLKVESTNLEYDSENSDWVFNVYDGTGTMYRHAELIDYKGTDPNVVVPATVNGIPVTMIGSTSRYDTISKWTNTNIESLDLSQTTIASIPYGQFSSFKSLKEVKLPETIKTIESSAFSGCTALESINFSASLTSIGSYAFYNCKLGGSLKLSSNLAAIGDYAFYKNKFTEVDLSETQLNIIMKETFRNCSSLEKVSLPDSVTEIRGDAFYYCSKLNSINVPSKLVTIGDYAFASTKVSEMDLSQTKVETIGICAFLSTGLKSVKFPSTLKNIGSSAFSDCRLDDIDIYNTQLQSIEDRAFYGYSGDPAKVAVLKLPETLETIGDYAFTCNSIDKIVIPKSVKTIGENAFSGTSGGSKTQGVTYTAVKEVELSSENEAIAFENGVLYTKASGVIAMCMEISDTLIIPEGVTKLPNISGFTNLKKIVIPSTITSISTSFIPSTNTTLEEIVIAEANANYKAVDGGIYTKDGTTLVTFATAKKEFRVADGTKTINSSSALKAVEKLYIPASVTNMPTSGYSALKSMEISEDNEYYYEKNGAIYSKILMGSEKSGYYYFLFATPECTAIDYPEGTTYITTSNIPLSTSYYSNRTIKSITIPSTVNKIDTYFFDYLEAVDTFNIASDNAKYSCENGVVYDNENSKVLYVLDGVTTATVKDGITVIDKYALKHASDVVTLNISKTVTDFAEPLNSMPSLKEIIVDKDNATYKSINGMLFDKTGETLIFCPKGVVDIVVPEGTVKLSKIAFASYMDPSGYGVSSRTFHETVKLPSTLKEMSASSFWGSRIKELFIPESVDTMPAYHNNSIAQFFECELIVVENSYAHKYAVDNNIKYSLKAKCEETGHTPNTAVKENVVQPTGSQKGSYDEVIYCKECKEEISRVTKTIDVAVEDGYKAVTEELKAAGLADESAIKNKLEEKANEKYEGFDSANSKLTDIKLLAIDNNDNKTELEVKDITTGNMELVIPYPTGTNGKDYKFAILHMIDSADGTFKAGDIEYLAATNKEDGIHISVKSLSPMLIKWKDISNVSYGDLNGDGKIDSTDAVMFKQYLAGYEISIGDKETMDADFNGQVNVSDTVMLMQLLAGYDVKLGNPMK